MASSDSAHSPHSHHSRRNKDKDNKDKDQQKNDVFPDLGSLDVSGSSSQAPPPAAKVRSYQTHDNGGRPFRVDDDSQRIVIYSQKVTKEGKYAPDKEIFSAKYMQIHIGKDPYGFTPDWSSSMLGNSVLAQVDINKFIFAGNQIFEFELRDGDSYHRFVSHMAPNDTPQPYLIGKTHTYLMLENAAIPNDLLDLKKDVYAQYYSSSDAGKAVRAEEIKYKRKIIARRRTAI